MSADQPTLARDRRAVPMREAAMPGDEAPMTPELRALYEQFERETTWSAEDPALLPWELERLAGWFARLARGRFQHPWCGFVEPNLEFRADPLPEGDGARLRVYFEMELRPPGRRSSVVGRRDVFL